MQTGCIICSKAFPQFTMPLNIGFNLIYNNFHNAKSLLPLLTISYCLDSNQFPLIYLIPHDTLKVVESSKTVLYNNKSMILIKNPQKVTIHTIDNTIDFYFKGDICPADSFIDLTNISDNEGKKKKTLIKESAKKDVCSICHSEYGSPVGVLSCNHWYCWSCIVLWSKNSNNCPLCKTSFKSIKKLVDGLIVKEKYMQPTKQKYCYFCEHPIKLEEEIICSSCEVIATHAACIDSLASNAIWECPNCTSSA